MPEPDFALVPKASAPGPHPQQALLLIEVSSSSLRLDRKVKAPLYAEGVWTEHFTLNASQTIHPVSFPDVEFPLKDFLVALPKH